MRSLFARALAPLALIPIALVVSVAAPANAGWYEWTTNPCRPDVYWVETEGNFQYHWAYDPWDTQDYTYALAKWWPQFALSNAAAYSRVGWQCGWLGRPIDQIHWYTSGWYAQNFEGGQLWYAEVTGIWYKCNHGGQCWYV